MRSLLAILTLSSVLTGCAGCLDWNREAAALRQAHGMAVAEAAATNRFDVIPPLEEAGR